jgi:hypothetical protein
MRYYCTLFDRNYLSRGLALHSSLVRHEGDVKLFILCLDRATHDALTALALPRAELVSIDALERTDAQLKAVRPGRTPAEFYLTCKPALLRYVLDHFAEVRRITYLDADVYFFSTVGPAEAGLVDAAVTLTPHRFPPQIAHLNRAGEFNAGWVGVSATAEGRRFVSWWRERCIENCRFAPQESLFGDQKYLDEVPALFERVTSIPHAGVNAGPWNLGGARIETATDGVEIDGEPLVAFHFHGTKRILFKLYDSGLAAYGGRLSTQIKQYLYRPYLDELGCSEARVARLPADIRSQLKPFVATSGQSGWWYRLRVARYILARRTALIGP